jgi:preprotein translocase subunit SecB
VAKRKSSTRISPADKLAKVSGLVDFRLVEAHCKQTVKVGPLPQRTGLSAQIETQLAPDAPNLFRVVIALTFVANYEEDSTEPAILVNAKFQLTFETKRIDLATKEALAPFGENLALFIAWPYWREHVNNVTARMSLPPFVIPLLQRGLFQKEDETPSKPQKKKITAASEKKRLV